MNIYIHIPFCLRKCNYCDFYSVDIIDELASKYTKYLQKEIEIYAINNENVLINSVFFGGGTPTCINPKYIEQIINTIVNNYSLSDKCEITIEGNPTTNINFKDLHSFGINRISIGVQSFVDSELQFLGRLHDAKLAKQTLIEAKKYFENINIDLMFSIPTQTKDTLKLTLQAATDLDIKHISAYSLIFEEGTKLNTALLNNEVTPKNDDEDAELYETIYSNLKMNKYSHYEVSNFAKTGFECQHNLNYWRHGQYLGFGVAAHGFINNCRYSNFSDIEKYCYSLKNNELPISNNEILTEENIAEEKIFLGLRSEGINLSEYNFNLTDSYFKYLIDNNFAYLKEKTFRLTSKGYFLCDEITLRLLSSL